MQSNSFTNDNCISNAYQKMQALLDSSPDTSHWDWSFVVRDKTFTRLVDIHEHIETWARTPHVATAYVQNILWWDPTWFPQYTSPRVSNVESKASNVRTACLWQTIMTNTSEVQVPQLESYGTYHYDFNVSITIQPDIWSQDNVSFTSPDQVRTVWIDGAQNIDAITAGLIVLAPLIHSNDKTRPALGCSIDARWDESHHVQSDGPLDITISADVIGPREDDSGGSGFLPANNSDWKNIKATMDWLEALTPTVPYLSPTLNMTNPASTIANLLMSSDHTHIPPIDSVEDGYGAFPYQFWESVIATYFAEGVARVGYSQQLEPAVHFVDGSNPGTSQCVISIPVVWQDLDICSEDRPKGANLTPFSLQGQITGSMYPSPTLAISLQRYLVVTD